MYTRAATARTRAIIPYMAYELHALTNARLEVRCTSGINVHIAFDGINDRWTVEEDPEHRTYQNRGDALDRARFLARDPDFK